MVFYPLLIALFFLSLQSPRQFLFYLISNSVKLVDFHSFAKQQTDSLCLHIDSYANDCGVDITYLSSPKTNKDELARAVFDNDPSRTGLIAAFSSVELCRTMTVVSNHQTLKLETASRQTKCKHYYLYYNDEEFGWMFIKIQTWFPYNVQLYINGREYLSKLFDKNGINYQMYHNSFSFIDDFDKAQKIANDILNKKISSSFDGMIKKINVHLPVIEQTMGHSYYWCLDQCEFATDINFKKREDLSIIYKKLVEDDLSFLENASHVQENIKKYGELCGLVLATKEDLNIFYKKYPIDLTNDLEVKSVRNRTRFTLAHELAHCVLHAEHLEKGYLEFRFENKKINKDFRKRNEYENLEYSANIYAGQLLVPEHKLKEVLNKLLCLH